jgi:hypothetical protein
MNHHRWVLVLQSPGVGRLLGVGPGFIMAIVFLCLSCLVTGLGTSAPLITRMMARASKVSTDFYVQTNLPLAVTVWHGVSAIRSLLICKSRGAFPIKV